MSDWQLHVPDPVDRRTDAGDEYAVQRADGTLYTEWRSDPSGLPGVLDRVRKSDPDGEYSLATRHVTQARKVDGW